MNFSEEQLKSNLIWIDLEMTGLNPMEDKIIEIGIIPTDRELNILDEGLTLAVKTSPKDIDAMEDWGKEFHGKSGLIDRCLSSDTDIHQCDKLSNEYIKKFVAYKTSPLCGNSVFQDKFFINRFMPMLKDHLHYRLIDVSSFKEVYHRWFPDEPKYSKRQEHTAAGDIYESIEELKFYRRVMFK